MESFTRSSGRVRIETELRVQLEEVREFSCREPLILRSYAMEGFTRSSGRVWIETESVDT